MGMLEKAREVFDTVCRTNDIDRTTRVRVRPLLPEEAIGPDAGEEFVLRKGREVIVEALWQDARGQAFTDDPGKFSGPLSDVFALDLATPRNRAILVATLNAVLRREGLAEGTVHCLDDEPRACGGKLVDELADRFGSKRYGLVGLQPSILAALVERFGAGSIRVVDLDAENIGTERFGVKVWDGSKSLSDLVAQSDVVLATGSSIVGRTIDEIADRAASAGRPLVFFGNTISGVAALLGLERICPLGR